MPKRKKRIRKVSDKGALIRRLDNLWFRILKLERGEIDEITHRPANGLGVFHILCKSNHPRLRYSRQNCLLVNWMPAHYNWHHYTANDPQYKMVEDRIKHLRGDNYKEKLLIAEKIMCKHNLSHLKTLEVAFHLELKDLEGKQK